MKNSLLHLRLGYILLKRKF